MKVWLLLILTLASTVSPDPLQVYSYRFKSVKCSGSTMNSTKSSFCFVRNYSRDLSTMNYGFNLNRILNKMLIKFTVDYKYGAVFHTVMDPPTFEWCTFYIDHSDNILFNVVLDMIKDSISEIIHKCPYQVKLHTIKNTFQIIFGTILG